MSELIYPGERLDDLCVNGWKIIQQPTEFRFSIDAVLLAHFATVKQGSTAVDLCTGSGILCFLLTSRGIGSITGIEINQRLVDMAQRSVKYNRLGDKIAVLQGDIRNIATILPRESFSLITANPPYWPVGKGKVNPNFQVAAARHELTAALDDVVRAAAYLTQYRGRFAMVHIAERLPEIVYALKQYQLEPKRMQLVQPFRNRKPDLLLIEAVKGGSPGLELLPTLVVYNEDGQYSHEVLKYYGGSQT